MNQTKNTLGGTRRIGHALAATSISDAAVETAYCLGLVIVWAMMVLTVHPAGDFPLADDWAYADSVRALLDDGVVAHRPWTPAVSISHTLWGAAFSSLFGFSFETLRAATLVLGLAGIVSTYGLLRELELPSQLSFIGALTVTVNPVYFALAGTFMTDVSFYAMSVVAVWSFTRTFNRESTRAFWIGTAAAVAATMNRQIGIAIPMAFAVVASISGRPPSWLRRILPLVLACGALIAWDRFVRRQGGPTLDANVKLAEAADFLSGPILEVAKRSIQNAIVMGLYIGLFALPYIVSLAATSRLATYRHAGAVIAGLTMILTVACLMAGLNMPALPPVGSFLLPTGIGPLTLRDTGILHLPSVPSAPMGARVALTAASVVGCIVVLALLVKRAVPVATPNGLRDRPALAFLVITGLLWAAPQLISFYFDRYLLPLVPLTMALIGPPQLIDGDPHSHSLKIVIPFLLFSAWLSVAGVHDYLGWNQARLSAAQWLAETQGADASVIDGGFEWNAWRSYDPQFVPRSKKSWWWVADDRWVIAFGPIEGREEVHRSKYRRWLPPGGMGSILVLERR